MEGRRRLGAGRPRRACGTCKSQKIRCTEERPSCKRCVRLHHVCTYSNDAPRQQRRKNSNRGNRQALQVTTAQTGNSTPTPNPSTTSVSSAPSQHSSPPNLSLLLPSNDVRSGDGGGGGSGSKPYLGSLEHLLPELVEIYFTYAYNAHLLLRKKSFVSAVADGSACTHVVLSVCAWAAKFYEDANGHRVLKDQGFMLEWAQRAGKLVFADVEDLQRGNFATFMNLALFWHSLGSWRRSYLYKGNAFLLLDLLGLGSKAHRLGNTLESETRRRHFWACHLMHCHTSEKGPLFKFGGDTATLPLPWPDEDFERGETAHAQSTLDDEGNGVDGTAGGDAIFAELIRGATIWYSAVTLLRCRSTPLASRIPSILALDERLRRWWRRVDARLKLKLKPTLSLAADHHHNHNHHLVAVPRRDETVRVLHLNTLYHQTLCALHASVVPLFSCGTPADGRRDGHGDGDWDGDRNGWLAVRRLSAQIAFEQANEIAELVAALLLETETETEMGEMGEGTGTRTRIRMGTRTGTSAVPMFMGYAAYCACAVLIPFMWSSDPALRARATANVNANEKLLRCMAGDWTFASVLGAYIHYLYALHSKDAVVLEDEPRNLSSIDFLLASKGDASSARASILEYVTSLRMEGGGFGAASAFSKDHDEEPALPENRDAIPEETSRVPSHPTLNAWGSQAEPREICEDLADFAPTGGEYGLLDLLYPFGAETMSFGLDGATLVPAPTDMSERYGTRDAGAVDPAATRYGHGDAGLLETSAELPAPGFRYKVLPPFTG